MRLAEIAEYSALTEAQQLQYDESLDNYLCYYNTIEHKVKKARQEAETKAHQNALKSAFAFFTLGNMSVEQIAQIMDLDVNELNDYIKDNSTKA